MCVCHLDRGWEVSVGLLVHCRRRFEEERRLFYVAVTRAKRHLFLTYPINVFDKGSGMLLSKPSRFLDPVSPAMLDQLVLVEEGRSGRLGPLSRPRLSRSRCIRSWRSLVALLVCLSTLPALGERDSLGFSAHIWKQITAEAESLEIAHQFLRTVPADFVGLSLTICRPLRPSIIRPSIAWS